MTKDFEDFRNNVITGEKLKEISDLARAQADLMTNEKDFSATFSANVALFLLAEYHDWLHES